MVITVGISPLKCQIINYLYKQQNQQAVFQTSCATRLKLLMPKRGTLTNKAMQSRATLEIATRARRKLWVRPCGHFNHNFNTQECKRFCAKWSHRHHNDMAKKRVLLTNYPVAGACIPAKRQHSYRQSDWQASQKKRGAQDVHEHHSYPITIRTWNVQPWRIMGDY